MIVNSMKIFFLIKTSFYIIIYIQTIYDLDIIFYVFILFLCVIFCYSNYLEYNYQYGQDSLRKVYFFFSVDYLLISFFLTLGFLIKTTSFNGLINILCVFIILSAFIIFSLPKKEMEINLENYSFKNDLEVYNQLKLISISMKKRKNNRKYLLDLAAYWYKYNNLEFEFNHSSFDNDQLELFIYKYIDKTFRTMIHKFNNSPLLTVSYACFLCDTLSKFSKAYIILYDCFYNNPDLTFSQYFFIYKNAKELQEKAFEIGIDKTDISYKYQCNTFINLICQISDIYINFWTLLLNSQEHQDINRLKEIGNKINEINEKIEDQFQEIKKLKIKEKSIYTLYNLYKRDILNEISVYESDDEFNNMEDYYNQNSILLSDLNSFISSSDFQFIICSGKEDNFGIILKISQEFTSYFGYTDVEVIGQHLNIFIPEFMRKKHDELLIDRISKIKLHDKISNSLKRHVFFFKTSSKYIYPIPLDVCTIFDEDGKATIFGKVDYDNIHIFHREVSANCHILTNENLIIQTFSHNCLHMLKLSNFCMNGSVEISKYIKEFYNEFFNRITNLNNNISKKIDKQKLKISILKEKYFTSQPEEIITFGQKQFKMNVEELKLNGFLVGYIFHFVFYKYDSSSSISKNLKLNLNISKTITPPKTIIKNQLQRKSVTENINNNSLGEINGNFIPKSEKLYFNFEKKAYQFNNKNIMTIEEFFNKELEKTNIKEDLSSNSSSSNFSEGESINSESEDYLSSSSSFEFSEEKKIEHNIIHKTYTTNKNISNYLNEYYKVDLSKISLSLYDYKKHTFINIPKKTYSSKLESVINKEKLESKQIKEKRSLKQESKNEKNEEFNNKKENKSSSLKRKNKEIQSLKKYYTSKLNNSIKFALSFELFHIIVIIISGILFFTICFKDRNLLIKNIELTRYLIKFFENSDSTLTYSFQLALLRNPKYTNFFSDRERIISVLRKNLINMYQDCIKLLTSYQSNSINLSNKANEKINNIIIYYYIIDDSLNVTQIYCNMKTIISQYSYSIYNFANSEIEDIHFLNKDYIFIMLNSNDFFNDKIIEYIHIMFEEFHSNVKTLKTNLWIIASVSLFFLIISLIIGIKTIIYVTSEKEKLLRYFFGIEENFVKNAISKCQKFIDLNKNISFDSKYLISKPKIKIDEDIDNVEIKDEELSIQTSVSQIDDNNKLKNLDENSSMNKNTFFLKQGILISDKKSLKGNGSIYVLYILTIISFVLIIMVNNDKKYRDIGRLLKIYYTKVLHKSIFIIGFNHIRIYILFSCSSLVFESFSSNPVQYIQNLYSSHEYYQSLFTGNLSEYELPKNSSYYYKKITTQPLYNYFDNFASKYNLTYQSFGSNIIYYGVNALMIYFIGTLLELYKKLEVFIEHSKSTGFLYNDISYGSDFYTGEFISDNQNEIDIYNQNDPFQLFNDIQLVELNVLNEEIYRPAIESFIEALSLDIDKYGENIKVHIERICVLFFIVVIGFNFFFYIPFFSHKNKDINRVRQMLMIIPKDILFKIIEQFNGKKEAEEQF